MTTFDLLEDGDGAPFPGWVQSAWQARNTSPPGLLALAQQLREDEETPPVLRELARRFVEDSLYRDDHVRARTTDPDTSQAAARRVAGFVRPGGSVHRILAAYYVDMRTWNNGLTSREVEDRTGVKAAHKRTSELLADGLLEVVEVDDWTYERGKHRTAFVRDGGRVLRITDKGQMELARLDAKARERE